MPLCWWRWSKGKRITSFVGQIVDKFQGAPGRQIIKKVGRGQRQLSAR